MKRKVNLSPLRYQKTLKYITAIEWYFSQNNVIFPSCILHCISPWQELLFLHVYIESVPKTLGMLGVFSSAYFICFERLYEIANTSL